MKSIVIHGARDLRVAVGGICGSDLHYYNRGGFGAVRLKKPMSLGHEVSGHVEARGAGVSGLTVGQLVAVPLAHAERIFGLADDRTASMKVQIAVG